VIDFGTYFISEWPFLAPEQPSLLLRPPTGFAPKLPLSEPNKPDYHVDKLSYYLSL
jgi:hypothetical protein